MIGNKKMTKERKIMRRLIGILACVIALCMSDASALSAVAAEPEDSCIAYFNFESNTEPFVGNGALYLDGSSALKVVKEADDSPLLTGLDGVTVSFYCKPENRATAGATNGWPFL